MRAKVPPDFPKRLIYTDDKGTLRIVRPSYVDAARFINYPDDTDDALHQRCLDSVQKQSPGAVCYVIDPLSMDRYFRNAWKEDQGQVSVDMAKAPAIHMESIRQARKPLLEDLDHQVNLVEDAQGDTTALRVRRQALRDIPQTFDLSQYATPETLKASWPSELPDRE